VITKITQAVYSANSKGNHARAETRGLCADARLELAESNCWSQEREDYRKKCGKAFCKIRVTGFDVSIIVITDKPQKPLPAEVWEKVKVKQEVAA
jgi:hypothetical protein